MNERYQKKTCDINNLIKRPELIEAAKQGKKIQQRRNGVYAYPGETFELEGTKFIITDLKKQTVGEMTEPDAVAEGFQNLADYKNSIFNMHKGMKFIMNIPKMESMFNKRKVWVHYFERL